MSRRWLQIQTIRDKALGMSNTEFELMFPNPVLVAAIVKGGKLIRTDDGNKTMQFVSPNEPNIDLESFTPSLNFMPILKPRMEVTPPWVTIGRTTASHVVINDYTVSKDHGRLLLDSGNYQLEDTRSRNGTWLEEVRLRPFTATPLNCGAQVRFGRQAFTFFSVTGFRRFILDDDLLDKS